jgi:hypothetical protein
MVLRISNFKIQDLAKANSRILGFGICKSYFELNMTQMDKSRSTPAKEDEHVVSVFHYG